MNEKQKSKLEGMKYALQEMQKRNIQDLETYSDSWITGYAEGAKTVCEYVLKQIEYIQKEEI